MEGMEVSMDVWKAANTQGINASVIPIASHLFTQQTAAPANTIAQEVVGALSRPPPKLTMFSADKAEEVIFVVQHGLYVLTQCLNSPFRLNGRPKTPAGLASSRPIALFQQQCPLTQARDYQLQQIVEASMTHVAHPLRRVRRFSPPKTQLRNGTQHPEVLIPTHLRTILALLLSQTTIPGVKDYSANARLLLSMC